MIARSSRLNNAIGTRKARRDEPYIVDGEWSRVGSTNFDSRSVGGGVFSTEIAGELTVKLCGEEAGSAGTPDAQKCRRQATILTLHAREVR